MINWVCFLISLFTCFYCLINYLFIYIYIFINILGLWTLDCSKSSILMEIGKDFKEKLHIGRFQIQYITHKDQKRSGSTTKTLLTLWNMKFMFAYTIISLIAVEIFLIDIINKMLNVSRKDVQSRYLKCPIDRYFNFIFSLCNLECIFLLPDQAS